MKRFGTAKEIAYLYYVLMSKNNSFMTGSNIIEWPSIKKDYMNNFKLSFVQGRLSKKIGTNFQHFPINNWQDEFTIAKRIKIKNIEWIISDLSNPIFNPYSILEIDKLLKKNQLKISSISLDLIMKNPFHQWSLKDIDWLTENLNFALKKFKIKRLNLPCEETSRFFNNKDFLLFKKNSKRLIKKINKDTLVSLESDFSPKNLKNLIKKINSNKVGINLDIGNIEANGFKIDEFFEILPNNIFGIHLKNRKLLFGSSKRLGKNYNLEFLKENLYKLDRLNDVTLQTFRGDKNFIKEFIINMNFIKKYLNLYD